MRSINLDRLDRSELSREALNTLQSIEDMRTQDPEEFIHNVVGQWADDGGMPSVETMMVMAGAWKRFKIIERLQAIVREIEDRGNIPDWIRHDLNELIERG